MKRKQAVCLTNKGKKAHQLEGKKVHQLEGKKVHQLEGKKVHQLGVKSGSALKNHGQTRKFLLTPQSKSRLTSPRNWLTRTTAS